MSKLVIVESPTKAKTISKFLGKGFTVKSSFGHIRDLPKSKLGVDVDNNFEPKYTNSRDKSATIKELRAAAKKADEIYFATDEDREGEAISWHLAHVLKVDPATSKRITFHEITKHAITEAMEKPRTIDMQLVDAQQARRVLDRLVGYKLSPLLWHKVARGLSAGRVQSVTLRLIVEREREIEAFDSKEYWSITAQFTTDAGEEFEAKLHKVSGKKLDKMAIGSEKEAKAILDELENGKFTIASVATKDKQRQPQPPYRTSTLQQDANNKLGYSSKQTMRIAQQLYEGVQLGGKDGQVGLITYMRTDSVNLSEKFLNETYDFVHEQFGKEYQIDKPREFSKKKVKGAQEAHEAIRPTHVQFTPESIKEHLDSKQFKLYDLIWKRAVATQMANAILAQNSIEIANGDEKYLFRAAGSTIKFDGFLKIYPGLSKETILPVLKEKESVDAKAITPNQHFTEPPARYSDATLVKALEERGIGRPSTYAPTIATIEKRNYVERNDAKRFAPTDIGILVNDLLVEHFASIVDYDFTAKVEDDLDEIAEGKQEWNATIKEFYGPFAKLLEEKEKTLSKKELTEEAIDKKCPECKSDMIIKAGRFGKFIACTGYPECRHTEPVDEDEKKEEAAIEGVNDPCEKCGKPMAMKHGRFGPFLGCSGYPDCKNIKSIEKKTGVDCPTCGKGEIIVKRSKRGRNFYGCNQYPDCDQAYWSKPTGAACPTCKALLVHGAKDTVRCSNKECTYKKAKTEDSEE